MRVCLRVALKSADKEDYLIADKVVHLQVVQLLSPLAVDLLNLQLFKPSLCWINLQNCLKLYFAPDTIMILGLTFNLVTLIQL